MSNGPRASFIALDVNQEDEDVAQADLLGSGANPGERNPTRLNCSGSALTNFEPDSVFALMQKREQTIPRSLDDIRVIDISNNSIPRLPRGFAKTFNSVVELNIRNNRIRELDRTIDYLTQSHSLRTLKIKNCTNSSATADPKAYVDRVGARLCGVTEIDDIPNPHALTESQFASAEDLHSLYQVSCNSLSHLNLSGKNIHLSEFTQLLDTLRDLPIKSLNLTNNPVCSAVHNYRLHVIYALPNLVELDNMKITDDERGNAHRIVGAQQENGMIKTLSLLQKGSPGHKNSVVQSNKGKVGPQPEDSSRRSKSYPPDSSGHIQPAVSDGNEAPKNTLQYKCFLGGRGTKQIRSLFGLDFMANLGEDIREPIENIWGTTFLKLELLVDYLQLYVIVSSFQIEFPNVWESFNEGDGSGGFVQGVLGQDVENIGDYWRDFELPDWAKHIYFFFLMVLPLWLWYLYKRKPKREKWLNDYVMNWSNTFWRIVLSYSLILIVIVTMGLGWQDSPSWVAWLYLVVGALTTVGYLIALFIIMSFRRHHQNMQWWYRYIELRKRACLFGIYELYTPITRVILQTWQAVEDEDGDKGLRRFDDTVWPFDDNWTIRDHWPMFLAALFFVLYVIGIPALLAYLIFVGSREAEQNFGVNTKLVEIKALKMDLKHLRKKDRTLQKYWILQRENKARSLYGHAVRNYRTPQTSLFEDYRREGKYFKVGILYWKAMFLFLAYIVTFENTDNTRIDTVQSGIGFIIAMVYLLITMFVRPYHALNENVIQALSATGVGVNTMVAYIIANSSIDFRKEYSLTLLFVSNVSVIFVIIVVMIYAPILSGNMRIQRRRLERQLAKNADVAHTASTDTFKSEKAGETLSYTANGTNLSNSSLPTGMAPASPDADDADVDEYDDNQSTATFDTATDGTSTFHFLKEAAQSLAETLFPEDDLGQQTAVELIHKRIGELSEIMRVNESERSKLLEEFYESICEQVEDTLGDKII